MRGILKDHYCDNNPNQIGACRKYKDINQRKNPEMQCKMCPVKKDLERLSEAIKNYKEVSE